MAQEPANSKPLMLTIPKLGAMKLLPERAIRRLVAENAIPAVKVGSRRYINLAVFEAYLAGRQELGVMYGDERQRRV
jgi:excisionase family DNA binding protein